MSMNKRFTRSVLSAMLVTVLGGLSTGALAVDVARVLVVQNNAYVKLYTIDDQNNWTAGDTIVTGRRQYDVQAPHARDLPRWHRLYPRHDRR